MTSTAEKIIVLISQPPSSQTCAPHRKLPGKNQEAGSPSDPPDGTEAEGSIKGLSRGLGLGLLEMNGVLRAMGGSEDERAALRKGTQEMCRSQEWEAQI